MQASGLCRNQHAPLEEIREPGDDEGTDCEVLCILYGELDIVRVSALKGVRTSKGKDQQTHRRAIRQRRVRLSWLQLAGSYPRQQLIPILQTVRLKQWPRITERTPTLTRRDVVVTGCYDFVSDFRE